VDFGGSVPGFPQRCGLFHSDLDCRAPPPFDELSLARVGAWGAVAGLLVGMVPFVAGSNSTNLPTWLLMLAIIGPITLLSAVSAGGSLALSRRAEKLNFLDARAGDA
jgi:hypothetical protein